MKKLWQLWYRLMIRLRIMRLDIFTEQSPELDDEGTVLVNIVVEPKWLWQR